MALLHPITAEQTDARSPVDQDLMDRIRLNLDHLDSLTSSAQPVYEFKVNGPLNMISNRKARRVDGALLTYAQVFTKAKIFLDKVGSGGTLDLDIRAVRSPRTPIQSIQNLYDATIQSIARAGSSLATQLISRSTPQIATQSIARFKTQLNIQSIILLGSNLVQYNLSAAPDSDWVVGDSVTFASCSNAANNGTFTIVRLNDFGSYSVIVENASGVAQTSAAGTADLCAWKYTFTNPVSSEFAAGEVALFASHTNAANDGSLTIYAVNSGGNNIVVKNASGVAQAAAAGTVDVKRFQYSFAATPDADFVVGETAHAASHTSGSNDGDLRITAVGATSLTLYNPSGTTQGSAAGAVTCNRWVLSLPTDPSSGISEGDTVNAFGNDSFIPAGTYEVAQVNRSSLNNVVIHSEDFAATAIAAGTLRTTKKKISFSSDQSAYYSTASYVELEGCVDTTYNAPASYDLGYPVLEVNRGGGANYNIIIDEPEGAEQDSPRGWVKVESRSIFSTRPTYDVSPEAERSMGQNSVHSFVVDEEDFVGDAIAENTSLCLYLFDVPTGDAESLTVQVN